MVVLPSREVVNYVIIGDYLKLNQVERNTIFQTAAIIIREVILKFGCEYRNLFSGKPFRYFFINYSIFFDRKEFGLDKFVPVSLMESMKRKELRKLLTQLLKFNQEITGTPHKTLTSLQAKLYYLTIMSELPSYGAKCFSTGIRVRCVANLSFTFCPLVCWDG